MPMPDEETLHADGFEDAFIGYGVRFKSMVAVYDGTKRIDILVERDGMTHEEAVEFMDFNVTGAYVGDYTPIFLFPCPIGGDDEY